MNHHTHSHDALGILPQLVLVVPFLFLYFLYIVAIIVLKLKQVQWPMIRTCWMMLGITCAVVAVSGPIAERAHHDFVYHMLGHLLLGMLAPLLIVLSAPMTLFLRALKVTFARKVTKLLKSRPFQIITNPAIASLLNVGGLWILYTTELFTMMHENVWLYVFIHFHVFLAGYVFTISMIYIDPAFHRTSYLYRSIVLLIALAAHGILSKYIYANPPAGIPQSQAEIGGMLMFYGGDAVDIIIIFLLCLQWYQASRPRISSGTGKYVLQSN